MSARTIAALLVGALTLGAQASWYWPFGESDDNDGGSRPRLSELTEPASMLIDEASDLAADNKIDEAVAKYREALKELQELEEEYPDRVDKPEFATVRTKKAYVSAAVDSLLMNQARVNARAVAVSDTTELERKFAEEQASATNKTAKVEAKAKPKAESVQPKRRQKDLTAKPGSAKELNVQAMQKAEEGDFKAAEQLLDKAIRLYPRSYYAYYNMAWLIYQANSENLSGVRRYYETGRAFGGPVDKALEAILK